VYPAKLMFAITAVAPLLCAQGTGSISGLITNSITGAGVEGVKVRAACAPGGAARCPDADASAVTDTVGAFRLSALPGGHYLMFAEKDGFSLAQASVPVATVSAPGDARFDMKLIPLASLQGRVVDPEGKPVAGVTVQFGRTTAVTNDVGAFALQKLSPATSQLWTKVKPQPYGKDGERLVNTYYPSAIDAEQALPIPVQGVDLSGYEIRLRTAPARTVRGVLLDSEGSPVPHATVELAKAAAPGLFPLIRVVLSPLRVPSTFIAWDQYQTGADGVFEFPAVLEGDWILKGYNIGTRQGGFTEVQVGRSDVDNLTVHLVKSFPIEVSPEWSDSQPTEPPRAAGFVVPLDGQVTGGTGRDVGPPFTQHDEGLPGRYLFGPGWATPGYYVSAAMLDGRNVLGQAVELSGPTSVTLIFKKDGGTLRGTVEKGGGSTVVLMAEPTAYARFGLTAYCDPNGNFSIRDVPPGSYTAVAFRDEQVLYKRDLLIRIDSAHGELVTIDAGASQTVALKVN
jgi:hypothetical protein